VSATKPSSELRPATIADAPAAARVFIDAWRVAYAGVLAPDVLEMWDPAAEEAWIRDRIETPGEVTVVALDGDGSVTGFARYGPDPDAPDRGQIYSVYVAPACGRRGIGSALVRHAVEALAERGLADVSLWAFEANEPARALYASLGFVPDGSRRVEPAFRAPEIRMVRAAGRTSEAERGGFAIAGPPPAPEEALAGSAQPQEALGRLATEQVRADFDLLDQLAPAELVALMAAESRRAPEAVVAAQAFIALAVERIAERMDRGGRLVYVGAGTSGRLGVLDAAEAGPTFDVEEGRITALIAGGQAALIRSAEAAEDDAGGAIPGLERMAISAADAVVGITASGRTPYVIGALDWARDRGALTVAVACNRRAPVSAHADVSIELEVGGEVIAGSTRLNAGTAQKVTLNIISTGVMVLLGRTYGNRMVSLRATNAKLRDRALRMVAEVTGAGADEARAALEASTWDAKVAIAMLAGGVDAATARAALELSRGRLRSALEAIPEGLPGSADATDPR